MKPTIFLASRISTAFREQLASCATLVEAGVPGFADALDALCESQRNAIGIIVAFGSVRMPNTALDRLPRLGLICCLGSGYDGIDLAYAKQRGLWVTNSPSANAQSVADLALGLLISSVRNLPHARQYLEAGRWQGNAGERMQPVRGLTGRKVGICGLGAIGLHVARRAAAFDMEVGYHSRHARKDVAYRYHTSILALADWADVLVVALRADASTFHAIDAKVLQALGPEGYLINVSRGSTVDEVALIEALTTGRIAGAGLDVYEHEPQIPAELFQLAHVTLTPHIGGSTLEAAHAQEAGVLANIEAHLAGQAPLTPVPL
ncbi:2-hydroxyacid dehydrogenase [Azomonas macrocytogenes]|uniref:Lactate dehydrogenase-like 2-hydroxyacid dehydrogenase n=1 Tax=Azomonas macrocytogenes TaxID=69962 RepID=A0A839T693_AZOMA|nr:2-hydroxyacid dehydrogenase [Azomonas macrocytogenes]MBB3103203.1 lactate dehydrogenase-like 2-hydroxyacid dehydrogenase [Azomonas macrocytogenes]